MRIRIRIFTDRRAFYTGFVALAILSLIVVTGSFLLRTQKINEEAPAKGSSVAAYGIVSGKDQRRILDEAYRTAELLGSERGWDAETVNQYFANLSGKWLADYFRKKGYYNVSITISSNATGNESYEWTGKQSVLRYGNYTITVVV